MEFEASICPDGSLLDTIHAGGHCTICTQNPFVCSITTLQVTESADNVTNVFDIHDTLVVTYIPRHTPIKYSIRFSQHMPNGGPICLCVSVCTGESIRGGSFGAGPGA